jgi:hypothetical protein
MVNRSCRALACAVLCASATIAAQTPRDRITAPQPSGTASVTGRMTIATTAGLAPIRRARVVLESDALREAMTTDTDTDGRYRFDKLPAGSFRITGEKAGFTPVVRDPRRVFEKPALIEVSGNNVIHDLPMQRGAAISGVALKDNGDPAINIVISAVRVGYSDIGRTPIAVRSARTNDIGQFRIHSLPPGDYLVDAAPDPLDALNQPRTPPRPPALARTYFPGSPRLEDARVVPVTIGQEVNGVDITMTTMTTTTVSAGIVNAQGQPLNDAVARIQRVGGAAGEVRGFGSIEGNTFTYPVVPPGEFWLMAVARPAPGVFEYAATKIRVEGVDQPNLRLITLPGAAVQGRVEGPGIPSGVSVAAVETAYTLPPLTGDPPFTWTTPVGPDGAFSFASLFGPRLFRLQGLPDPWAIKGIWAGDQDITDTPFDISSANPLAPLRVIVTSETGTLSGIARDAKGAPVANARIVVFGDDERAWGRRSRTIKTVETGADGRYEVRGLLEGKYSVVAASFLEDGAWFDAAVLRQLKLAAAAIAMTPGKHTLDLVVKP